MDWSQDIIHRTKSKESVVVTGRIGIKYKKFIDKNKINLSKLIMRACEELDSSLKSEKEKEQ